MEHLREAVREMEKKTHKLLEQQVREKKVKQMFRNFTLKEYLVLMLISLGYTLVIWGLVWSLT